MGIPYSKQINAAFDQVTPLVAEGFEVLQTTRNVTFVLAEIQVITVFLLAFILVAMMMLLVTTNPDLERERQALVTPAMRWLCSWAMTSSGKGRYGMVLFLAMLLLGSFGYAHYWYFFVEAKTAEEAAADEQVGNADQSGKDVEAIQTGKTSQ